MSVWGHVYWSLFHSICKTEPSDGQLMEICESFAMTLPCPTCRRHFTYLVNKHKTTDFASKEIYGWLIHDEVNTRLGKPRFKTWGDGSLIPQDMQRRLKTFPKGNKFTPGSAINNMTAHKTDQTNMRVGRSRLLSEPVSKQVSDFRAKF